MNGLDIRMEREEESLNLKKEKIEITQSEQQRESNLGKKSLGDLWNQIKYLTFMPFEYKKERRKRVRIKKHLKKWCLKSFQIWPKKKIYSCKQLNSKQNIP